MHVPSYLYTYIRSYVWDYQKYVYILLVQSCSNNTGSNYYIFNCDGINDCADGSDEANCCKHLLCLNLTKHNYACVYIH